MYFFLFSEEKYAEKVMEREREKEREREGEKSLSERTKRPRSSEVGQTTYHKPCLLVKVNVL